MESKSVKQLRELVKALEAGNYNSAPLHFCTNNCYSDFIHVLENESKKQQYYNDISVDSSGNIITLNYNYIALQSLDTLNINFKVEIG